jgi:hypothetical protein
MLTFKKFADLRREKSARQELRELRARHAKRTQMLSAELAKLSAPRLAFEWTGQCADASM